MIGYSVSKSGKQRFFQLKILCRTATVTALFAALCACGSAKVSTRQEIDLAPPTAPNMIYVADFDLDASKIKSEPGILPSPPKLPGPLGKVLPPPPGSSRDPQKLAHDLVESMSRSLVDELNKAGETARRLAKGGPEPTSGWLVRGVFTDVNQGNQLRRAVIGFGAGKTDLQVLVDISDLSRGVTKPFYEVGTTAESGRAPGAGPLVILGPAGVAARFVIAGNDLERNVRQSAAEIAAEIVTYIRANRAP